MPAMPPTEVLHALSLPQSSFDGIDNILFKRASRRRQKKDPDQAKANLENKYLSPPAAFSAAWVNKLQQ